MPVTVRIPVTLRSATEGLSEVDLEAAHVGTLLKALEERFPGLAGRLSDGSDALPRFMRVYVNGRDVQILRGAETPLGDGDVVWLLPPLGGGRP
ncbi:MAG: MoaD/ThiS family protein [Anaerolineae bacterium]|nr:MoaD/ThiS family protein [Anaerolineae bacterium]